MLRRKSLEDIMRKLWIPAALALVASLLPLSAANAQFSSDTDTASASVTIVSAISITKTVDMNFGDVVEGAGTVILATDNGRTATGNTTLGNSTAAAAASFSVTGDSGATYAITLPGSAITLTGTGTDMTVDTFVSDHPGDTGTLTGGTDTILVGATLNVGATQTTGAYTGSFDLTVAYN
jgi:Domain of unknown function (DUF4402)